MLCCDAFFKVSTREKHQIYLFIFYFSGKKEQMFQVWRRWLVGPQGAAESWEGSSRFHGSLKPARKPLFIQHLLSPDGRKLKERKSKWIWTQLFDFLRVKKGKIILLSQPARLGKHLVSQVQKKNRSFHFLMSDRKKKERRQTSEAVSVSLQLHPAAVVELQLVELVVFGASCEAAEAAPGAPRSLHGWPGVSWRTLPPLPQETRAAPFSPSLSFFSREDSKSSSSTADMSFSPPLFFPLLPTNVFPQALHAQTSGKFSRRL